MGLFGTSGKKKLAIEIDEKVYNAFVNVLKQNNINEVIERLLRDYIVNNNKIKEQDTIVSDCSEDLENNLSQKQKCIQLARNEGYGEYDKPTYAKWGNAQKYYMNPNPDNLRKNWLILLDDIENSELHILLVPEGKLNKSQFHIRPDTGNLDIHIGKNFVDTPIKGTHVDFSQYFRKTIHYNQLRNFSKAENNTSSVVNTFSEQTNDGGIECLLQKWLRKKTAPYNVMKTYFVLSSGGKTVTKDRMQRYAFNELHENNFQPIFSQMKNGGNNVSAYRIFEQKYNHSWGEIVVLTDDVKEIIEKYRQEFLK